MSVNAGVLIPLQTWGDDLGVDYYSETAVIFFAVFAVLMVGIGILASRYQTNQEEYFVAGRRSGVLVVALAVFASIQSGWGMIGVTGTGYLVGLEYFILVGGLIIFGFTASYWLLGRKMRVLGDVRNAITAPDAMYYRFQDERVRLLGAASVLLGSMGYLAAQYAALGIVGSLILPISFFQALVIGLVVVGFYTVIGGMLAAIWSDAIQGAIMVLGGVLTAYYVVTNSGVGWNGMIETIQAENPAYFEFTLLGGDGLMAIGLVISVIVIQATVAGQPHAITKFYMVRDVSVLKWGALITGSAYLATAMYWLAAPFLRAAVIGGTVADPGNPDATLPLALIQWAPDVVVAFVLTAVMAAIMSTSNAFLNMGASAVVHDYFIEHRNVDLTQEQEVHWGRLITAALLIAAGVIAATFPGLIFVLGAAGWAIFAAVIFPCIAIAYNWRGATAEGALAGGGAGLALTILLAYGGEYAGVELPLGFLGGQLATIVAVVVFVGVSLVTSTSDYHDLDEGIKAVMDLGRIKGSPEESTGVVTGDGTGTDD
ncbi:sodium:solute symporter family transporter [Natrinema limicola]|uniref:Na+/solute symporter n=1 Tax=Natrinema limicola JCM 13563 TaxID=1230457 RepID=M0CGD7_9EURY|nr:Na+/solute symporter [Natrinema limicola]ELZ21422.1 Na+/solute symporter [Natrinema limicola JCM 13563]